MILRKIAYTFLFLSLLVFIPMKGYSSHVVGSEFRYESLGGNNYRFQFTLYRDCSGIRVDTQYAFVGNSVSTGAIISFAVLLDSMKEVRHTCSTVQSKCSNAVSPYFGIEVYYYHADVTLLNNCSDWIFGLQHSICNRSPSITNLTPNGSTYCIYVNAMLNNADFPTNSSPVFAEDPRLFICASQVQHLNHNATDIDGDSLTYQLIYPHSDPTMDVQYIAACSNTQPVTCVSAADSTTFNTQSGDIRFKADGPQNTVIAVQINEYRNGILIGTSERDIEVFFETCTNHAPTASGFNGTTSYTAHVCVDSLLTFRINTFDADTDKTYVSWVNHVPESNIISFTDSGSVFASAIFTWHPQYISYASSIPYTFFITVTDSACPTFAYNTYQYNIYVDSCYAITTVNTLEDPIQVLSASYSPSTHQITYNYRLIEAAYATISLYDITGRKMEAVRMEKTKDAMNQLEASNLSAGIYLLNLKTESGLSKSVKVVVE